MLSAGCEKVPRVELAPLVDVSTPRLTSLGPLGQEQALFVEGWEKVEGVWPDCSEVWDVFITDLSSALLKCPSECSQTFAGRLIEMLDTVCWRQDDFELVLEKQNQMAAVIHASLGPSSVRRPPHKSKEEQLREWEREFGPLPIWMGLRKSSERTRAPESVPVGFPSRLATKEQELRDEVHMWHPPVSCPRSPFPAEIFYLILFSGHRREGDIASQIWLQDFGDRVCWPLCLDLCLDTRAGDLCNPTNLEFWRDRIRSRQVIGMHASPPCETYSEARFIEIFNDEGTRIGPRPLRSWSFPWGLPGLSGKELRQVSIGNLLFYVAMIFASWFMASGGCASVEHPKGGKPSEGRFAIWFASFLQRLERHEDCYQHTFCQGHLGQCSLKPTTFLLLRLGSFTRFRRQLSTFSGPFTTLGGKSDNGAWKTSSAKEFPPALCRAVALSVATFVRACPRTEVSDALTWPSIEPCSWRPFDPYMTEEFGGTKMGPDYWGG